MESRSLSQIREQMQGTGPKKARIATHTFNGIKFRSMAELAYYRDHLLPSLESGKILALAVSPRVKELVPGIGWELDFSYIRLPDNKLVYVDVKGRQERDTELKQRLWATFGEGELQIVKPIPGSNNGRFMIAKKIQGGQHTWICKPPA